MLTQTQWLLAEFEKGRHLTQLDMLREYGIGNHTGRISDIRKALAGEGRCRQIIADPQFGDNGKQWMKYSLYTPQERLLKGVCDMDDSVIAGNKNL